MRKHLSVLITLWIGLVLCFAYKFYFPGSYLRWYEFDEEIEVLVDSITSSKTASLYGYYSLPFCRPVDGIKKVAQNLGEVLMGDEKYNSHYRFKMQRHARRYCVSAPLEESEVKLLEKRIDEDYRLNIIVDNLPALINDTHLKKTKGLGLGLPIGFKSETYSRHVLYNNIYFRVLIRPHESNTPYNFLGNRFMVVGFEATPLYLPYNNSALAAFVANGTEMDKMFRTDTLYPRIQTRDQLAYSYNVLLKESNISWGGRWDAYREYELPAGVYWTAILLNSLCIVLAMLWRQRRDARMELEAQPQTPKEFSGEETLVAKDVSRAQLLCVVVGNGAQIMATSVAGILCATFLFKYPSLQGNLLTNMVMLYHILGFVTGYISSRLWCTINGSAGGWTPISWKTSCFFPAIAFTSLTLVNGIRWVKGSSGTMPISVFLLLLLMWIAIDVPSTFLGGDLGVQAKPVTDLARTNLLSALLRVQFRSPFWAMLEPGLTVPILTVVIPVEEIPTAFQVMKDLILRWRFMGLVVFTAVPVMAAITPIFDNLYSDPIEEHGSGRKRIFFPPAMMPVDLLFLIFFGSVVALGFHNLSGAIVWLGYVSLIGAAVVVVGIAITVMVTMCLMCFFSPWRSFSKGSTQLPLQTS